MIKWYADDVYVCGPDAGGRPGGEVLATCRPTVDGLYDRDFGAKLSQKIVDAVNAQAESQRIERSDVRGAKPVCLDCNATGIMNCSHFDNCSGKWVYKPTTESRAEIERQKQEMITAVRIMCEMIHGAALNAVVEDFPELAELILSLRDREKALLGLLSLIKKDGYAGHLLPDLDDALAATQPGDVKKCRK